MAKRFFALFATILCLGMLSSQAKVRLPKLISDRMVLQRGCELKIWGWADAGENVTVRFRGEHFYTTADNNGNWSVSLPKQTPGGPFLLEVNEIIIRDVLVGDVYLASGQSNQETPIVRLVERFPEIEVSNNHMIRHYKVPYQDVADGVREEIASGEVWHSAIASDVMTWTALAYFFAQEAYAKTGIPIGILNTSKGGTAIQSWVSQEHLKDFPELILDKTALNKARENERDKGINLWNRADYDDSSWSNMTVPGTWQENGINARGVVWHRKTVEIPESMVGRHAILYMGRMAESDSVFVNGTFVGATSYQYPPRKYQIPANVLRKGKNVVAVKLTDRSGRGEFVKDKNFKIVGDEAEVDLRGEWKWQIGQNTTTTGFGGPQRPSFGSASQAMLRNAGSNLYNGMVYPLRNYAVCAAIWYQGEANDGDKRYFGLLTSLMANWRELWGFDMPFLLVQLPNFMEKYPQPSESGWAIVREAQLKVALNDKNSVMATTYDIGEWNDIHPLDKKSLAQRLMLGARKIVYGEKVQASGPLYKDYKIDGNKIIISFSETGRGLAIKNGEKTLKHFAIAGEDGVFVWADAIIKGNTVIVSSPQVPNPVAVRYAWANNPDDANLINKDGLLASPFRTDEP